MNALETWAAVLGWSAAINLGVLVLSGILVIEARRPIAKIHAKMFGMNEAELPALYFQYLAQYKIVFLVFNLAPYIAIRIVI